MSRKTRVLQKRFAVFCEGDTEYNYIDKMRKNQGVELVLKPINMHGGGYSNFLQKIKTESQSNYLAKFIIMDADRIATVPGELDGFKKLLEYCRIQNAKGNTPHFIIMDNPDLSMWHAYTVLSIEDRIHINLLNLFWEQKVLRLLKEMQMFITSLIQENCHIR